MLQIRNDGRSFSAQETMGPEQRVLRIGEMGQLSLGLCFTQVSMMHENKAFFVSFSCPAGAVDGAGNTCIIHPTETPKMVVIRHRLVITQHPPENWYKDEGGRDKAMTVSVKLINGEGNFVRHR